VELNKWNVREYELTDEEGEKAYILYRPMTQGWRAKHLEVSLRLQKAIGKVQGGAALVEDPEGLSEEQIEELVESHAEAMRSLINFQREMLLDLVTGCRELTIDGESPSPETLVDALVTLEGPAADLVRHIVQEGSVSAEEGKD
jgi:hypothetical protein